MPSTNAGITNHENGNHKGHEGHEGGKDEGPGGKPTDIVMAWSPDHAIREWNGQETVPQRFAF